jgi:DNA repair exonuclease SbcCD ATPase subunit
MDSFCSSPGCKEAAKFSCFCDPRMSLCEKDYSVHCIHLVQNPLYISRISQDLRGVLENLESARKTIITKAETMIKTVQNQVFLELSQILSEEKKIESILDSRNPGNSDRTDIDIIYNIQDKSFDIETFPAIAKNYLNFFINHEKEPLSLDISKTFEQNLNMKVQIEQLTKEKDNMIKKFDRLARDYECITEEMESFQASAVNYKKKLEKNQDNEKSLRKKIESLNSELKTLSKIADQNSQTILLCSTDKERKYQFLKAKGMLFKRELDRIEEIKVTNDGEFVFYCKLY